MLCSLQLVSTEDFLPLLLLAAACCWLLLLLLPPPLREWWSAFWNVTSRVRLWVYGENAPSSFSGGWVHLCCTQNPTARASWLTLLRTLRCATVPLTTPLTFISHS